jgi:hypothetical protein
MQRLSPGTFLPRRQAARPESGAIHGGAGRWTYSDVYAARHQGQRPYLHGGRCQTLDDTVEFFNLKSELKLTQQVKKDLMAFLQTL